MHNSVLLVSPMCGPSEASNSASEMLMLPVYATTGKRLGFTSGNKCVRTAKANSNRETNASADIYLSATLCIGTLDQQGTEAQLATIVTVQSCAI